MDWLMIISRAFTGILFAYLAFSAFYTFIFSLSGIFYADAGTSRARNRKIAVIIPGYKEDSVIIDIARTSLNQSYNHELYDVIVIADSFQEATLSELKKLDIKLIEVHFDISTKARALNKALEILPDDYDLAVILDADNIMEERFLEKIDMCFADEMKIMQCHRTAKNLNTDIAVLDAISEEINNHLFRKGHRVFGLSAALIGSAMVFDYKTLRKYMPQIQAVGGFDKELDMRLLQDKNIIYYLDDALVYDEKVQDSNAFIGQRKRWLSAQFVYLGRYFGQGFMAFFRSGNVDFLDKVLQMALFPRILLLGTLMIINMILFLLKTTVHAESSGNWITPGFSRWAMLLVLVIISLAVCIPRKHYGTGTYKALTSLPLGFLLMLRSLLSVKGSNKRFIHTPHGTK